MDDELRCLDRGGKTECQGPVEPRLLPDRDDFKTFPRCEAHFEKRLATVARTLELTSPTRGRAGSTRPMPTSIGERITRCSHASTTATANATADPQSVSTDTTPSITA